ASVDFGGGSRVSAGDADAFLAQYDLGSGAYAWDLVFGGSGYDAVNAVELDASNGAWFTATFSDTVTVGGQTRTSAGGYDALLGRVTSVGAVLDSTSFGGANDDGAVAIAVDPSGGARVVGYFQAKVTI